MRTSAERAAATADIIIKSCALYTRTEGDPFFFSSGWASPVFIDCKKIISSPDDRTLLVDLALESIAEKLTITSIDFIAGCELTGVPFATLIQTDRRVSFLFRCGWGRSERGCTIGFYWERPFSWPRSMSYLHLPATGLFCICWRCHCWCAMERPYSKPTPRWPLIPS